jgi:hypothetical protein
MLLGIAKTLIGIAPGRKVMRKGVILAVMVGAILVFSSQFASADLYSGAWLPTDGDVNFLSFDFILPRTYDVFMFDFDNVGNSINVLNKNSESSSTVKFIKDGESWKAEKGASVLDLGTTPYFGLYFDTGPGTGHILSYDIVEYQPNLYNINVTGSGSEGFLQIDAMKSAPIPGALILLGAGLVRLVAYSRRKRAMA